MVASSPRGSADRSASHRSASGALVLQLGPGSDPPVDMFRQLVVVDGVPRLRDHKGEEIALPADDSPAVDAAAEAPDSSDGLMLAAEDSRFLYFVGAERGRCGDDRAAPHPSYRSPHRSGTSPSSRRAGRPSPSGPITLGDDPRRRRGKHARRSSVRRRRTGSPARAASRLHGVDGWRARGSTIRWWSRARLAASSATARRASYATGRSPLITPPSAVGSWNSELAS